MRKKIVQIKILQSKKQNKILCAVGKEQYIYMSQITIEECKRRVNAFLDAHLDDYTEREIKYIRSNSTTLLEKVKDPHALSILAQIYDEVGITPKRENLYPEFLGLLEENFDINRNIVEVGSGPIPLLARQISLRQKSGTITVYDPRLIIPTNKQEELVLKKEVFRKETLIPNAEMLIGFMPCDATIPIIESACLHELDFMVALCEGGSRSGYEWLETDDEWIGYIEYMAKKNIKNTTMGTLEITKLDDASPYPVIYNKRKK